MRASCEQAEGGLLGLLIGDALGVPYEFHGPEDIPSRPEIDMEPPMGFLRSYSHVPPGTWSDDGAQALCLLESLLDGRGWVPEDFAARLIAWHRKGHLAVDGLVFDIGIQTSAALDRLERGIPPSDSGLAGERNNGNGSLMRTLPVALLHEGDDASLASLAQAHSRVTHAHPRSQACCATYALWARYEILHDADPWSSAIESLHAIYPDGSALAMELDGIASASSNVPTGTGYVVDCLLSAKRACEENSYDAIVRTAISLGHDTDTTACVAGGIAGIRHGKIGIPSRWLNALRGREILRPLLEQVHSRLSSGPSHGGV